MGDIEIKAKAKKDASGVVTMTFTCGDDAEIVCKFTAAEVQTFIDLVENLPQAISDASEAMADKATEVAAQQDLEYIHKSFGLRNP